MRRLLLVAVAGTALGSLAGPAMADHMCYGVDAGINHAGVCVEGTHCSDLCEIELDPYCHQDDGTRAMDLCGQIDNLYLG